MRQSREGIATLPFFVAIGASGRKGLKDIEALLSLLPQDLPAVVLVVLHRPSDRISHLRDVLSRASRLPVVVAKDGDHCKLGSCYIGEPADHLALAARSYMRLVPGVHDKYRNRTVDLLFASVALYATNRAIGVILDGSLDDGSRGLKEIHDAGGITMAIQTKATDVSGMPENARTYDGPVDVIGTIDEIAVEIIARTGRIHRRGRDKVIGNGGR